NRFFLINYRIDAANSVHLLHRDQLNSLKKSVTRAKYLIDKQSYEDATITLITNRTMALSIARELEQVNFCARNHILYLATDFDLIRASIRHRHGDINLDCFYHSFTT